MIDFRSIFATADDSSQLVIHLEIFAFYVSLPDGRSEMKCSGKLKILYVFVLVAFTYLESDHYSSNRKEQNFNR
jgi:hypothetical protein